MARINGVHLCVIVQNQVQTEQQQQQQQQLVHKLNPTSMLLLLLLLCTSCTQHTLLFGKWSANIGEKFIKLTKAVY